MEAVNTVLNNIANNWEVIAALAGFIGLSGIESLIMAPITKKWGKQKTDLFKMMSVFFFMAINSAIVYLATSPEVHPVLIPLAASARYVMSQSWYLKLWKPLINNLSAKIDSYREYQASLKAPAPSDDMAVDFSS